MLIILIIYVLFCYLFYNIDGITIDYIYNHTYKYTYYYIYYISYTKILYILDSLVKLFEYIEFDILNHLIYYTHIPIQ